MEDNLHDQAVLDVSVFLAKLSPGRSKALAVSAPRGVELDKDILVFIEDGLVKLIGDKDENGLILRGGDWLALERGLELAFKVLLDKLFGTVGRQRLGLRVWVLELLGHVLHDERRPFDLLEVHRLAVFSELDGVDPDKVDLALELLGERLVRFGKSILGPVSRVDEEIGEREAGLGVEAVVFTRDFIHQRSADRLEPLAETLKGEGGDAVRGIFDLALIKLLVDNECRGLDTSGLDDLNVRDLTEKVVFTVLVGGLGESGGRSIGAIENDNHLVGGLETFMHFLCNWSNSGERLPNRK